MELCSHEFLDITGGLSRGGCQTDCEYLCALPCVLRVLLLLLSCSPASSLSSFFALFFRPPPPTHHKAGDFLSKESLTSQEMPCPPFAGVG